jgi:hypothetical protein
LRSREWLDENKTSRSGGSSTAVVPVVTIAIRIRGDLNTDSNRLAEPRERLLLSLVPSIPQSKVVLESPHDEIHPAIVDLDAARGAKAVEHLLGPGHQG